MTRKPLVAGPDGVVLLSGGNPQIAKGDGDAPVAAWLAAAPGWKGEVGRRLDALVVGVVPDVAKAVRWNSPCWGVPGNGYFFSLHCLTKAVRATFFKGTSLEPMPPGFTPKSGEGRWFDVTEAGGFDAAQMAAWVRQAAALPGWDFSTK